LSGRDEARSGAFGKYCVRALTDRETEQKSWICRVSQFKDIGGPTTHAAVTTKGFRVNDNLSHSDEVRRRVVELVSRAEAIVEALEMAAADGRWAMTAFSRYRMCELLDITPYTQYDGNLDDEPASLLEEAARVVDGLDVPIEELSWRLAVGDALRTAAADIRMVQDARDV
jgi:hypothetical protein